VLLDWYCLVGQIVPKPHFLYHTVSLGAPLCCRQQGWVCTAGCEARPSFTLPHAASVKPVLTLLRVVWPRLLLPCTGDD